MISDSEDSRAFVMETHQKNKAVLEILEKDIEKAKELDAVYIKSYYYRLMKIMKLV